jgi:4-amino-4-deoxy-L-arabinose transferase-like glycosyltransferase
MHVAPLASPERPPLGTALEAARRRPRLALVLLCLALFLPGFFSLPATDRDEARFAQASRQMVESGDHVRIRFGEEERNKKPAGIHWLQSASVQALEAAGLGDRNDIWAYRVPSLLGAMLAVLATFHWGRALVGRRATFLGAAMLASSLVLVAETHIAKTDAALLATVAASMGLFGAAYMRPGTFSARQAAAFWLLLGAGVLLKGPIGPMVPLLAGITLAVADRGAAPWLRALRPLWGVPLMLAAAAPWFVAIGIATEGRFFAEALGGDMLAKVGSGEEKHWGPPGYYLLTFAVAAFPGAWIVLLALPSAWRDRTVASTRFLLAWAVPSWLLFEAAQTKLPHYTLPLFPALMLLGAAWAMDPLRRMPSRRWWRAAAVAAFALVALGIGAAALATLWVLPRDEVPLVALLVPPAVLLLLWPVLCAARRGDYGRAALLGAVLAALPYAAALEGLAPRLHPIWIAPRLDALLAQRAPDLSASDFGITGHAEPSVVFAVGTGTRLLPTGGAAARFLAEAPPGRRRVAAVGNRAEADFQREAAAIGLSPREIGTVTGLNYTRGRWVTLILYRTAS